MSNKREKGTAYWPPPKRPDDDGDAVALRDLAIYCTKALTENDKSADSDPTNKHSVRWCLDDVEVNALV